MLGRWLLVVGALLASGCAAESTTATEGRGSTSSHIVGGTVSTNVQDSAVLIMMPSGGSCTGTLITPNLVLSARHCVATPAANACPTYGPTDPANNFAIYTGVEPAVNGSPAAIGAKVTTPAIASMCSYDVALIQLDRDIKTIPVATIRFTALTVGEPVTAVGYGEDGNQNIPLPRMQRATTVLGVGAQAMTYQTREGIPLQYNLPQGDIATGESTCYGDSGGPLFDAKGQLVGHTSRGLDEWPQNGLHGNGCIDLPSLFTGARFNEQIIRLAATAAGHPLPTAVPETAVGNASADGGADSFGADDESDTPDEPVVTPKKKKKTATAAAQGQSAGCSTTMARPDATYAPFLGLGLALLALRRRRYSSTQSR